MICFHFLVSAFDMRESADLKRLYSNSGSKFNKLHWDTITTAQIESETFTTDAKWLEEWVVVAENDVPDEINKRNSV